MEQPDVPADVSPASNSPCVCRLILNDFRSYRALDIEVEGQLVVLTGANGAGKTNIMEALSLLAQGRGLRRADLAECAREHGSGGWAVSAEIGGDGYRAQLGTGMEPPGMEGPTARKYRIDRAPVASARVFADHVRLVWLTPAMDGLFTGSPGERRRFLDRLVLAVDAGHGTRVNGLERALRNRNRLLEQPSPDRVWLDAAEREVAEIAVAVAAARSDTVSRLAGLILARRDLESPFPWAELALAGEVEAMLSSQSALQAEESYRRLLRDNRSRDARAGRTLVGPHTSDLKVRHGPKQADAGRASTGEQKALLTGLVLAHASLVQAMCGLAPILLLDEIAAHFDPVRRERLFSDLAGLGGQVWMSGADAAVFESLHGRAAMFAIASGQAVPLQA